MNLRSGIKGMVFDLKETNKIQNCITGYFSKYEKRDETCKPVYSKWKINFIGKAYKHAKILKERDKIILIEAVVNKHFNESLNEKFIFINCYAFEKVNNE